MSDAPPPSSDPREAAAWIETYYARGWSDGLPLVPPTREAVDATLAAAGLQPDALLGEIAERNAVLPAEKVAINAVLAGCRPEYFPVLVAACRGLCHPDFFYHGPATSTGGSSIALIVNGPIAAELGINAGHNAFGPGWRANATIGRALRLVMMNVLNTRPGLLDRATLGTPGKYSLCFAENEADCIWEPFHVWRGFRREQSTVTLYANNSLYGIYNQLAAEPEPLLRELADAICNLATPNVYGFNETLIVLAGEHSAVLRQSGWSRREVQTFLMEHARRTVADFKRAGRLPGAVTPADEHTWRHTIQAPEDLLIVCAGGPAGSWSACLPGWGNKWTRAVTIPIERPGEPHVPDPRESPH
jgi:hypothetical protein